jgi:hypothetical protein
MLVWPAVAVLGFVVLAGLVIGLGRGSTARYEYERNRVASQPQPAMAGAVPARTAGGSVGGPDADGGRTSAPAAPAAEQQLPQRSAVGVATHPAGRRMADRSAVAAWWLVDDSGDEPDVRVVAGPFADRFEADWAALANGLSASTRAVHGVQQPDGALIRRQSPQDRAWLAQLDDQLDRLSEDWDDLITDTDALTTLVVEVGAALVDAGLPLHDAAERGPDGGGPAGGVCLTPHLGSSGVLVSWRQHDRMSVQQVRGAAADAAVQRTMTTAVADVLAELGFQLESLGSGTCFLVTALTGAPGSPA